MSGYTKTAAAIGKWLWPSDSQSHVSLAGKTTALIAATFFAVLATTSLVFLHYQAESLKQSALEGLDGQAKIAARGIEAVVDEGLTDCDAVSATFPMQALAAGRLGDVESYLRKMSAVFPKYQNGMFLIDSEGRHLADYPSHPNLRGKSIAYREYYQRTIQDGKGIIGKPYESIRTGKPVITFTAPVRDGKGRILAIVACSMDLLSEQALGGYRKQRFEKTGYLYVFDKSRQLVVHPDDKREMTYVEAGTNRILEAALRGFEGAGETVNSVGVPMLLAVRHIPHTEWTVGVQITQAEGYTPIAAMRARIFALSGTAILLATVLGGVAIRRVTRPLQQLERAAAQISADLDNVEKKESYNPSPSTLDSLGQICSGDEVGRLASTFLHLAAKLDLTLDSMQRSTEAVRLQATALESAANAIVITDRQGIVQWVNPAYTVLTGYTAGEVVGRELNCLKPGTCDGRLYVHLWNTILSGAVWQGEMTGQRKDGTRYSEEITITPVRSDNGEISHFIAIKVDITQRKQAEAELRATANRLQAILEHAPVGIVSGTREYRFVETNAAFQRMTGYSGEELKQMDWKALTHPDDIAHNADLSDRLMQGKLKNYDLEKRYVLKDGRVIWVRSISAQLDDEHKISIIEDITERKEAVDKLRRSEIRLHRLIDSNIIGVVIHREDGSIIDANDAFLSMTGYTREDLANGSRWPNLTPPEYKPMHDRAIAELRQTGSFRPYEKEYLRKDGSRIPVLVGGVSTVADEAIIFIFDLTERKKAQAELARLARIVETTDEAILSISLDGRILSWNRGAEQLYGYSANEIIGQDVKMLIPEERKSEYDQHIRKTIESGQSLEDYETVRVTKSGEQKAVSLTVSPMRDESGQIASMSSFIRDLTQAKKAQQLEEQFRQAQKLEAVGRLTGGVAHDFNNLLMVISSYTETLEAELAPDDRLRKNTQQVLKATRRAASLTQQLLAFSRKQVLSPEALDLNTVVGDTAKMLKRLIGEDIELRFLPTDPPWPVMADPGQVTQVLMNLGINARDAMPKGGRLTIETHNAVVDAQTASRHRGFSPGHYTMIAISDTGTGMTKEVQDRIFEPFFTTKEKGKGTGLGLSTVYGIVKQSGGYIWVYSEVGKGSCFKLYFPRIEKPAATTAPLQPSSSEVRGETILLVEDEASVRESVGEYLRECGYEVLEASNGQQALEVMDGHAGPTHLLLTDVIMPKMSGPELARKLASRNGLVTLYMSGYTDDTIVNHGVLEPGSFIQKPFSLSALAEKVRNILDSASRKGQEQEAAGLGQIGQENASRATPPEPRVSSMLD